jgi:4-amino-4-deoxy-L-arabinose transferase-like glycosyltransferase
VGRVAAIVVFVQTRLRHGIPNMKRYLRFVPLLILYVLVVLSFASDSFQGDEGRYVWFAENLAQGFYSPADEINLWNGPGYPLVLTPFVLLGIPWLYAKLLNALFLIGAVLFLYEALQFYVPEKTARLFAYLLGLYPSFMAEAHLLITESLTFFLVAALLYYFCRLQIEGRRRRWGLAIAAGLALGFLCLTKIFFGYVLAASLLLALLVYAFKRTLPHQKTVLALVVALVVCLPYLGYTYSLTGKLFYWGDSGGMSLYWMSTPYEGEWGDWFMSRTVYSTPGLAENHGAFLDEIAGLDSLQKDAAYRQAAIENIRANPKKFVINWMANMGRLLFNYPYSYTPQKLTTYFYLLPNMFIFMAVVFSLYPAWLGRKLIPYAVYALALFGLIALGGSSLLSAYERQFRVLVPILFMWVAYVAARLVKIEFRTTPPTDNGYTLRPRRIPLDK